jgi:hypothetical protein
MNPNCRPELWGMHALSKAGSGRTARFGNNLCLLTWLHWKAVSLVKEQGATGLILLVQIYCFFSRIRSCNIHSRM